MAITKKDIWNAFRVRNGWRKVPTPEAKALIGSSAMRYWINKGWLAATTKGDVQSVALTEAGRENLETGIQKHLENHPEDGAALAFFPKRLAVPLVFVTYA